MKFQQRISRSSKPFSNWYGNYVKFILAITLLLCGLLLVKCNSKNVSQNAQLSTSNFGSITTSNGDKVILSDKKYGIIIYDNQFMYNDGTVINSSKQQNDFLNKSRSTITNENTDYMTVSSPSDRMFKVVLPDSTQVWLSANSSLIIPSAFNKSANRIVRLTGEANFDVPEVNMKSDQGIRKIPFIVLSKGQQSEVFRSRFNLNTSEKERSSKTSVFTGNLKLTPINTESEDQLINTLPELTSKFQVGKAIDVLPNQFALLAYNKVIVESIKGQEVMEWSSDDVVFRNATLEKLMTVVATWYNMKVIYKISDQSNFRLGGAIERSNSPEEILKMLSLLTHVKFKINDNEILVYR